MSSLPLLEVEAISKVFKRPSEPPIAVLQQLYLQVGPNDQIAIVGKSGAGKSTLLHILGTLEAPSEGRVTFLGQDIFTFSEQKLSAFRNRQLGFVFQFHYLMLEFTALENVMMPALLGGVKRKEARKEAENLLKKVGLSDRLSHKPSTLSGGEQQRVAIARALMMRPKLLLTDEMTGNLDPITGGQVFDLVRSIREEFQLAMISVTHDEKLAASYPKVYELTGGRLVRTKW